MTELNWNLSWTLMTIGVCWLFVSCAVALALGRIIQRSKASAAASQDPETQHADAFSVEDESESDEGGSRAASGTRMKPVWLGEPAPERERKVS
jgi:hypothetical protein